MGYETISFSHIEKGIGHLTLCRTHCYNAINHAMMEEIEDFWRERLYDLDTVVIILSSECEKGFCAGLDMKETAEMAPNMSIPEFYRFQARLARLNLAMRRAPQADHLRRPRGGRGTGLQLRPCLRYTRHNARRALQRRVHQHRAGRRRYVVQLFPSKDDRRWTRL